MVREDGMAMNQTKSHIWHDLKLHSIINLRLIIAPIVIEIMLTCL